MVRYTHRSPMESPDPSMVYVFTCNDMKEAHATINGLLLDGIACAMREYQEGWGFHAHIYAKPPTPGNFTSMTEAGQYIQELVTFTKATEV